MDSRSSISRVVALLLLVAVMVIFVSPAFDIPATALRAKALAQLLTLVLAAAIAQIAGLLSSAIITFGYTTRYSFASGSAPPLDLTLPLLC